MDTAFKTAAFPGYTSAELKGFIATAKTDGFYEGDNTYANMERELERRTAVDAGDMAVMTPGERLRFRSTGVAR